jgi:general secretion pathway protein N
MTTEGTTVRGIGGTGLRGWHAALFFAAFAVFLAAAFPARWAGAAVEHATNGKFRVVAASGSPWQGRGEIVMRADGRDVPLGPASWRWLPARMLAGELAFEVTLAGGMPGRMIVALGPGGAALRNGDGAPPGRPG